MLVYGMQKPVYLKFSFSAKFQEDISLARTLRYTEPSLLTKRTKERLKQEGRTPVLCPCWLFYHKEEVQGKCEG